MTRPEQAPLCTISPKLHPQFTGSGELQPGVIDPSTLDSSVAAMGSLATYSSVEIVLALDAQRDSIIKNLELMRAYDRALRFGSKVYIPGIMVVKSALLSHPGSIENEIPLHNEFDKFANNGDGPETRRLIVIDDTGPDSRTRKLDRRALDVKYLQNAAAKSDRVGVLLLSQSINPAMGAIRQATQAQLTLDRDGNASVTKTPGSADDAKEKGRLTGLRTRADDDEIGQISDQMIRDFREQRAS